MMWLLNFMMIGKVNERVRVSVIESVVNGMLMEMDRLYIMLFIVGMIELVMSIMIRMVLNLSILVMIWLILPFPMIILWL